MDLHHAGVSQDVVSVTDVLNEMHSHEFGTLAATILHEPMHL